MKRDAMLDERAECLFKPITKVKKLEAQSLAEKSVSLGNQHCANYIGALSFAILIGKQSLTPQFPLKFLTAAI